MNDQIGEGQRQRCFRQPVVANSRDDPEQETARKKPNHAAADEGNGKLRRAPQRRLVRARSGSSRAGRRTETIAAASLSSASPSTRRVSRAGAPTSRKMAITAAGSVVATTAPSSRQTTSGTRANGHSAKPITAVAISVAITARSEYRGGIVDGPPDVRGNTRPRRQAAAETRK